MDHATNFSLDVQEMYQTGNPTPEAFKAITDKYGTTKRPDGITLDFSDGSSARWVQAENSWLLNPKD